MKRLAAVVLFAVTLIAVFALHHDILTQGFYADDYNFLFRCEHPTFTQRLHWFTPSGMAWYYRVTFLWYWWALLQIFGPNPVALHSAGLVIHAANITLLALLVYRIRRSVPLAVLCGALALIWPGQRDGMGALDWIAAHSALLALFFSLCTIHAWLRYRATGSRYAYAAALVLFWCALTSKEDANSLPLALLVFDGLIVRKTDNRPLWGFLRPIVPFVVAYLCYLVLDVMAYRHYRSLEPVVGEFLTMPGSTRVALMFSVWNLLTLKALYFTLPSNALMYCVAGLLMAVLGIALRSDRTALTFYLWSLATVAPMPLAIAYEALHTRFLYVPMMVVAVMCGVLISTNWIGRCVAALVAWSLLSACAPVGVGTVLWLSTQPPVWIALVAVVAALLWRRRGVTSATALKVLPGPFRQSRPFSATPRFEWRCGHPSKTRHR